MIEDHNLFLVQETENPAADGSRFLEDGQCLRVILKRVVGGPQSHQWHDR